MRRRPPSRERGLDFRTWGHGSLFRLECMGKHGSHAPGNGVPGPGTVC